MYTKIVYKLLNCIIELNMNAAQIKDNYKKYIEDISRNEGKLKRMKAFFIAKSNFFRTIRDCTMLNSLYTYIVVVFLSAR